MENHPFRNWFFYTKYQSEWFCTNEFEGNQSFENIVTYFQFLKAASESYVNFGHTHNPWNRINKADIFMTKVQAIIYCLLFVTF